MNASDSLTSNRPFLKVAALMAIIVVCFGIVSFFPDLLLTLIIAYLLAFVLKPLVKIIEYRLGMRRSLSIAIVFLATGTVLFFAGYTMIPLLITRIKEMYDGFKNFPFDVKLSEAARSFAQNIPFLNPDSITATVRQGVSAGVEMLGNTAGAVAGYLVNLAIVPFITYFILAEGDEAIKKLIEKVPNKYFEMTLNVLNKIETDLVGYLRGWILDSIIIGILSVCGYYLIGIDYAILIGVVAGIANLIPYLGPIVGAVPAFLVSLTQYGDFQKALPIIVLTFSVQLIDNIMVQPLCFAKTVDMHPVTVILVLLIGNTLMGVAGMLLAIPIATILKASALETYWGLKHYRITA